MSVTVASDLSVAAALALIRARAGELDRHPRYPHEDLLALNTTGALRHAAARGDGSLHEQIALVRAVAKADASTARIVDGHLNGVERLVTATWDVPDEEELALIEHGEVTIGVWGADPVGLEGRPAWIECAGADRRTLHGVKVFCSGAGGVDRALVVARDAAGARRLAYVDARVGLRVDRDWYRASGLRASESHRVEFCATPVLTLLGGPDELAREPWFARDGTRTAATWAGLADAIAELTGAGAADADLDAHQAAALGRMRVHISTIELWLEHATRQLTEGAPPDERSSAVALAARAAIAEAARAVSADALVVGGSRALVAAEEIERCRRDLEVFVLQHRLEPALERLGYLTVDAPR